MSSPTPLRVALIGAGNISTQYLETLALSDEVVVVAIGDRDEELAARRAAEFGVDASGAPERALADDVDLVVNLTPPTAHAEVTLRALQAGKHVWSEKPLALDPEQARMLTQAAARGGLVLGCAPDTVLGPSFREALAVIRGGAIGTPRSIAARMGYRGPERWHPHPDFLYQPGAGPMWDMGPYYLTACVEIFGPVATATAVGSTPESTRRIATGPRAGEVFDVAVPSTVDLLLTFRSGGTASLHLSFDAPLRLPVTFRVDGTTGAVELPDPNEFVADAALLREGEDGSVVREPLPASDDGLRRGTGVLDIARALRAGEDAAPTGDTAAHVVRVLAALDRSLATGGTVSVE